MRFVLLAVALMAMFAAAALGAGAFDTTFSGDGKRVLDFTDPEASPPCFSEPRCPEFANAGVVGGSGKLTVVGFVPRRHRGADFAVVRLTRSGRLDNSFGADGLRPIDFHSEEEALKRDVATDVALTRDGRILVVGDTQTPENLDAMGAARLLEDGTLDASFSGDGRRRIFLGLSGVHAETVLPTADGGAVIAGCAYPNVVIAKLNRRGNLVSSFGAEGIKRIRSWDDYGACINESALQRDGKIVLVGQGSFRGERSKDGGVDFVVIRLMPDGRLDRSFGGNGIRMVNFGGYSYDYAYDLAIQRDGALLIGGATAPNGGGPGGTRVHFGLIRLSSRGRLDRGFSRDGRRVVPFRGMVEGVATLDLLRRGGILMAGTARRKRGNLDIAVIRLKRNGVLDRGFSGDGRLLFGFAPKGHDAARDVALARRTFYAVGVSNHGTGTDIGIARLRR